MDGEDRKKAAGYEFFDHTADIGIALHAPDLAGLLETAATALFDIITDRARVTETEEAFIHLEALDRCELLVSWLQELLFLHETHGLLFASFHVERASDTCLHAVARGEPYDLERHEIRSVVKAATYHGLTVDKTDAGFTARIVLDM